LNLEVFFFGLDLIICLKKSYYSNERFFSHKFDSKIDLTFKTFSLPHTKKAHRMKNDWAVKRRRWGGKAPPLRR
jgi:hypothetical protein